MGPLSRRKAPQDHECAKTKKKEQDEYWAWRRDHPTTTQSLKNAEVSLKNNGSAS